MAVVSSSLVIPSQQSGLGPPRGDESEPRDDHRPMNTSMRNSEWAFSLNSSFNLTRQRDPQPRPRPLSEPLFACGVNTHSESGCATNAALQGINELDNTNSPPVPSQTQNTTLRKRLTNIIVPKRSDALDIRKHAVNPVLFVRRWAQTRLPNDSPTSQIPKKLREARCQTHLRTYFIPEVEVERIVSSEAVRQELLDSNYSKLGRIRKPRLSIEDGRPYVKILTALYLMKQPSKIRLFVKSGVCDKDLPLEKDPHFDRANGSYELKSRNNPEACAVVFKRRDYAEEFLEHQWSVLAPVFFGTDDAAVPHVDLDPEVILPFLSCKEVLKRGGSSTVYKTNIHPEHDRLNNMRPGCNVYAIKALKSSDKEAFGREATILTKLSSRKHAHTHLITLLATYEHDGVYHLIFPWAELDLFDFWKQRTPEVEQMGMWVVEQCRGLAAGLNSLHRYATLSGTLLNHASDIPVQKAAGRHKKFGSVQNANPSRMMMNLFGRHGDLKPENILWYPDDMTTGGHGILKIADFGVTRFNTEDSWDTRRTGHIPNSAAYRSPEVDLDYVLTSACDVWALGCVYLQFITWYLGGYKLVERFGRRRLASDPFLANRPTDTFFSIYFEAGVKRAKVKSAVIEVMDELRAHQRCTVDFKNFLDIIKDDMLVVHWQEMPEDQHDIPVLRKTLSESASTQLLGNLRRKSCGDVFRSLGEIQPCYDQEEDLTRRDTLDPVSPITLRNHVWPNPQPSANRALLSRGLTFG